MKIKLPDSQDEITLEMYNDFILLDSDADNYEDLIFSLFTGIDVEDMLSVSKKDIDSVLKHIYKAIQVKGVFTNRFTINGLELGFIPNLDNITAGEYTDLVSYSSKEVDGYNKDLNKLLAVLYRPVNGVDSFGNYKLKKYEGTKDHLEYVNKLPMSIVNGCLGFFLTLSNDLENHIQASMEVEQAKELLL